MDGQITIPVTDYENYRNYISMHDKGPIIEELRLLVKEKDTDLKRYKEKFEEQVKLCQKLQKQLDSSLSSTRVSINYPSIRQSSGHIKVKTPQSPKQLAQCDSDDKEEVLSRALTDNRAETSPVKPVEHDETSMKSLPVRGTHTAAISALVNPQSQNLQSLPNVAACLAAQPGMSTSLLQRLVQDNLKLRKQVEQLGLSSRTTKVSSDAEHQISELKLKLCKKDAELEEYKKNSKQFNTDDPQVAQEIQLQQEISRLRRENESTQKSNEILNDLVKMLKENKQTLESEKQMLQNLVSQLRNDRSNVEETLQQELNELRLSEQRLQAELAARSAESDKIQKMLESAESAKALLERNYHTLCMQIRSASLSSQPSPITPPPAASYTMPYTNVEPLSLSFRTTEKEPPLPARTYRFATTQPSIQQQYSSMGHPQPLPREKKTFQCPKCRAIFESLEPYRSHIKGCLK